MGAIIHSMDTNYYTPYGNYYTQYGNYYALYGN